MNELVFSVISSCYLFVIGNEHSCLVIEAIKVYFLVVFGIIGHWLHLLKRIYSLNHFHCFPFMPSLEERKCTLYHDDSRVVFS